MKDLVDSFQWMLLLSEQRTAPNQWTENIYDQWKSIISNTSW